MKIQRYALSLSNLRRPNGNHDNGCTGLDIDPLNALGLNEHPLYAELPNYSAKGTG